MTRTSTSLYYQWLHINSRTNREEDDVDAKARRVVRANNFTQQTNALDVDKHMCVDATVSTMARLIISWLGWPTSKRT